MPAHIPLSREATLRTVATLDDAVNFVASAYAVTDKHESESRPLVLHRAAACHAHLYERHRDPEWDMPLRRYDVDDRNPTEQDNETPF